MPRQQLTATTNAPLSTMYLLVCAGKRKEREKNEKENKHSLIIKSELEFHYDGGGESERGVQRHVYNIFHPIFTLIRSCMQIGMKIKRDS
jgi:hypothetical protein